MGRIPRAQADTARNDTFLVGILDDEVDYERITNR